LQNPNWTGRLRLVSLDDKLEIRLEDKSTGNLYAKAPVAASGPPDFDQVSDSSRYFVIRLKNNNGQTAFIGLGFADRSDSFDLNVAIQDHFKSVKKDEELVNEDVSKPALDLSFKEGQTITVNIGKKASSSTQRPKPAAGDTNVIPLLPPPPSSNSRRRN
jgi:hypothetical protein